MSKSLPLWLLIALIVPVLGGEPKRDTPKREEGRAEDTISAGETFASDADRLSRVVEMQRRDDALIARLRPPVMFCRRVPDGSIQVDGKLDDKGWKGAASVSDFKDTRSLKGESLPARAMLAWDTKYLYVGFDCPDTDVVSTITQRDGDLWREDAAEIFIDPDGDGMAYLEFEVSASGQTYDGALADYRAHTDWLSLTHLDVDKSRDIYNVQNSKMAAHCDGTLNKSSDVDKGWSCEMAISWSDISRGTPVRTAMPRDGDRWRVGLYRINMKSHDKPDLGDFAAWSPTTSWFHVPKLFGHVIFVDNSKEKNR